MQVNILDFPERFEVIVVGGGHAGTEAALAAARMGAKVLLLTHHLESLGQMSCNPSIGGIGKGHLVKEVDALGGVMGRAADRAGIHFRILNGSKGPAVRATRAQMDRQHYRLAIRQALEAMPNLKLFQQAVDELILKGEEVVGVVTQLGLRFYAQAIVLTVGTFLDGIIHVGQCHYPGGRMGDPSSLRLSQRLRELPLPVKRLKTGTPPRLDGRSIDYDLLEVQLGDSPLPRFSFWEAPAESLPQRGCHLTYSNATTHEIIRQGLDRSPLYTGKIEGIGPRYCPSIEDKVVRFSHRERHQIYLEPEGLTTHEVYPNGISTSLPFDVQLALVRSIRGLEQAEILRPGYAIEYDFFDPIHLKSSLTSKSLRGLFFAGQINGTTGYEEAAAQGLLAGVNATRYARDESFWSPSRDQAYLGVMVDDLITQGTNEPYRMFTSRAEHRLYLREDNADIRLTPVGYSLGLVGERQWQLFSIKQEAIEREKSRLQATWVRPHQVPDAIAREVLGSPLEREYTLENLLRRPDVTYEGAMRLLGLTDGVDDPVVADQVAIQIKYQGYIQRQQEEVEKRQRHESLAIPENIDYDKVPSLSNEIREKLKRHRPTTLGQATRIPGMTPAAIAIVLVYLKQPFSVQKD